MERIIVDYHIGVGVIDPLHTLESDYSFMSENTEAPAFHQGVALRAALFCYALQQGVGISTDKVREEEPSPEERVYAALHPDPVPLPITEKEQSAIRMMDRVYQCGTRVKCEFASEEIYTVSARGEDGYVATLIAYLTTTDVTESKQVSLFARSLDKGCVNVYALDAEHNYDRIPYDCTEEEVFLTMPPNSVRLIVGRIK